MRKHSQAKINQQGNAPNFWDQLNQDIDIIGRRARDNLRKYQLKQYQTLKPKTSNEKNHRDRNPEMPEKSLSKQQLNANVGRKALIEMQKQENEKERMMKNKLAYLEVDKKRQKKTIEIARKKYENLVTIRKENFKQKQSIRKRKMSMAQEEKSINKSRINLVQTAREHKKHSLNAWRDDVKHSAQKMRFESAKNYSAINQQKERIKLKNIQKANKTRSDLQKSRSIISQINQRRKQHGRDNYQNDISSKIKSLTAQKKRNQTLSNRFKNEINKIHEWKNQANKQIAEYSSILKVGTNKGSRVSTQRSLDRKESVRSFYLTNY